MRRGTRVGQAYVAITGDGSGLNKDIVDSVDDAGDDVERSGGEHGERYGEEFGDSLRETLDPIMEKLGDTLSRRLSRRIGDSLKDTGKGGLGAKLGDALADRVEESMAGVEDRITAALNKGGGGGSIGGGGGGVTPGGGPRGSNAKLIETATLTERLAAQTERNRLLIIAASLANEEKMRVAAARAEEKLREASAKSQAKLVSQQQALYEKLEKEHAENIRRGMEGNAAFVAKFMEARRRIFEKNSDAEERLRITSAQAEQSLLKSQQALYDRLRKEALKRDLAAEDTLWKQRRANFQARLKYERLLAAGKVDERGFDIPAAGRGGKNDIGTKIGGLFGAGSRSNILNVLGRSIGGVTSLVTGLSKQGFTLFQNFSTGFQKLADGASLGQRVMSGFSGAGTGLIKSLSASAAAIPALGVALIALTAIMSVLVSVASALIGLLTALASTVVSALTGGLLVLGGAFAAAVAGAGLLTLAFTSMTDAQKNLLTSAFRPLKDELTGLGQLLLRDMVPAFDTWASNLSRSINMLTPLASVMGRAFANAGNIVTASLSGPGFQRFTAALTTYLPSITERMARALGGFLNGLTGVFAALMPFVNRFAGYLADVADRFSRWANSARGQNAIVDFTERALGSLKSLWNFVREFFGWLGDILFNPQSQRAGNTIFDGMADAFRGFRRAISDGSLEKWFSDAIDFGKDLWKVMQALGRILQALNNSGVLEAVGLGLQFMAKVMELLIYMFGPAVEIMGVGMPRALDAMLGPIAAVTRAAQGMGEMFAWAVDQANRLRGVESTTWGKLGGGATTGIGGGALTGGRAIGNNPLGAGVIAGVNAAQNIARSPGFNLGAIGAGALAGTSTGSGGRRRDREPREYVNPYSRWAQQFISDGPSIRKQVEQTSREMTLVVRRAMDEAARATDVASLRQTLSSTQTSLRDAGRNIVQTARDNLSSKASELANASSAGEAARALASLRRAQDGLRLALAQQADLNRSATQLGRSGTVDRRQVQRILDNQRVLNANLATMVAARSIITRRLETANEKLADAIAMRNQFRDAVSDGVREFGGILTAQARTLDGVQQALAFTDITGNLQSRLDQINKFRDNLNILVSRGLSKDAYKQLLEGGVEQGGAYAEALLSGGQGAVAQVNDLTKKINEAGNALGIQASNRLFQAGVDAARGLVQGLESQAANLDRAANRLGNAIANAVKRNLGINSPSTVMDRLMDPVGDGMVNGLGRQVSKVGAAATKLSDSVATSPSVAARYASGQVPDSVSGNSDARFRDLIVHTPTENPEAVAMEVLNEVSGRLP